MGVDTVPLKLGSVAFAMITDGARLYVKGAFALAKCAVTTPFFLVSLFKEAGTAYSLIPF
jgi:hypothetical protein